MSFADWDKYPDNRAAPGLDFRLHSGQNWGSPILHSSLANPLSGVGEGVYLRDIATNAVGASDHCTPLASIGASVKAGAFVGPDETRAQEARAWMRIGGPGNSFDRWGVAIGGRWRHSAPNTFNGMPWAAKGYFASFGFADPTITGDGTLAARLLAIRGTDNSGATSTWAKRVAVVNDPATAAPWLVDRWYRFRWRLTPTGLVSDLQEMHRLVDGGNESIEGDWLPVASMTISPVLDPTFYAAPGAGARFGFASTFTGTFGVPPSIVQYIDLVDFRETSV